ncbi:MAG: shikimate dehydrogenase [Actinomycetota bacterium]
MADLSATTRVLGVVGWPVEHSLSPAIHNAAFRVLDLAWVYLAFPVPPDRLPEALAGVRALGIAGANVTMPHKEQAVLLVDELTPEAERVQSVNTIVRKEDRLVGHNTDAPGFARFLREDAGLDVTGRTALLLGAGGAARACAAALADGGLARLIVALRDPDRVRPIRRALEGSDAVIETVPFPHAPERLSEADLLVNATPLGQRKERLPVQEFTARQAVVDLVYRPAATPLLEDARAAGAQAFGGLGMLLHQAALSIELWTGRIPPLPVMSAAALAELSTPTE